MDWLFLSILGTASISATSIIDKFILNRYVQNSTAYLISLVIVQQIFALIILAFRGAGILYSSSPAGLIPGFLLMAAWIAYLRALQLEDVSRVMSLTFVYPVFIFLGSGLLLGEALPLKNYAGAALLLISAFFASYRRSPGTGFMALSPALKYLFCFWIFIATYSVLIKMLLLQMDEWQIYVLSSLGSLLAAVPLLAIRAIRSESLAIFYRGLLVIGAVLLEESLDFSGRICMIFAYALGSVALVSSVGALQPLIVLSYIVILSLFRPGLIHEEIGRDTLALKLAAVVLVALGIFLIQ
ncbi:MAG TPA: hypothetical protein VN455_12450 [Methanotrichaceae archaeon]|nr:hypothetical protein [Methanotrichaceae archaeon]